MIGTKSSEKFCVLKQCMERPLGILSHLQICPLGVFANMPFGHTYKYAQWAYYYVGAYYIIVCPKYNKINIFLFKIYIYILCRIAIYSVI